MTSEQEPTTTTVAEEQYFDSLNAVPEEEEEETHELEDEGADYTPLGSDDPENARKYKEYKRLVKEIHFQNETIETIKAQINDINCKSPCPTKEERKQLKNLYDCMEQEMQKARCLTNKAMQLQNFGSKRHYKEIDMVTTFDEDNMVSIPQTCATLQVQTLARAPTNAEPDTCWRASGGDTTSEMDRTCSCHNCANTGENEEQQLMKEIFAALQTCATSKNDKKPCKKKSHAHKGDSMDKLKQKLCHMEESVNKLKCELCKRSEGKQSKNDCSCNTCAQKSAGPPPKQSVNVPSCVPAKSQELKKLKDNYMHLLTEFSKKDEELKELTKK